MEHLSIYFKHEIEDISTYTEFVLKVKSKLERNLLGTYLGDDMAIDGGDAEALFASTSAKELFDFIRSDLNSLHFMQGAKITFTLGDLGANAPEETFTFQRI